MSLHHNDIIIYTLLTDFSIIMNINKTFILYITYITNIYILNSTYNIILYNVYIIKFYISFVINIKREYVYLNL